MATLPIAIDARKAKTGASEAERALKKTTKAAKDTDQAVNKLDRDMQRAGKTASRIKTAFVSAFAGLSAFMIFRDITSTVADFGQEMSTLQAVTNAQIEQMADFEDQARALGSTTRFSATEAAEGMTFLARAGFDANEVLSAIPDTLDLAIAGALELGEAADIASNVLSQFNMQAENTGRVGDILVNTANSANTNVQQLAEALKLAGPVAGALGIALEETAASIGVLGDSGIQASLAGTNLRGVMSALLGPTTAAEKAIHGMGLTVEELDPSTNNLISIFSKFREANLSAADAVEIFGRRNAAAALVLTANVEKLAELTAQNEKAAGTSKEAAAIMQNNLANSFKALRSTIEEAWLTVGDRGFTGGLRSLVDTATDAIRILLDMEAGADGFSVAAKALAGAIRGVTSALVTLIALKAAVAIFSLTRGVLGLTGAFTALRTAMVTHPILAIAGIASAAALAISSFAGRSEEAAKLVSRLAVATGDLNTEIEQFTSLQKDIEKARFFERPKDEAKALADQVGVLENVLINLKNQAEEKGGGALTNFFDLSAVGVSIDDFRSNLDQLSNEIQQWAEESGENAQIGVLPLVDAIKLVEAELKQMKDAAIDSGIAVTDATPADDIQNRIDQAIAIKDSRTALEAQIQSLKDERELLRASDEYREIIVARREAEKNMIGLTDIERRKYLDTITEEIRKNQELQRQQEEREAAYEREQELIKTRTQGQAALDAYLDSLSQEREEFALTNEEKQLYEAIQMAINIAKEHGIDVTTEYLSAVYDEVTATQALIDAKKKEAETREEADRLAREEQRNRQREARENQRIAQQWAQPFADALTDLILHTESFKDSMENLYKSLVALAVRIAIMKVVTAVGSSFGGGGGGAAAEKGLAFDASGNITQFQRGDIVQGPTLFSYGGGNKTGLMGEAGPESEAIIPLKRTSSGRLGVEVAGGGGGGGPVYKTVNMNIMTKDADSFRYSKRQIMNDAQRGLG